MNLKKELLQFLEANNDFGLEEPEKIVDIYIESYFNGICKCEETDAGYDLDKDAFFCNICQKPF